MIWPRYLSFTPTRLNTAFHPCNRCRHMDTQISSVRVARVIKRRRPKAPGRPISSCATDRSVGLAIYRLELLFRSAHGSRPIVTQTQSSPECAKELGGRRPRASPERQRSNPAPCLHVGGWDQNGRGWAATYIWGVMVVEMGVSTVNERG